MASGDCPVCPKADTDVATRAAKVVRIRARRIEWCRHIADGSIKKEKFLVLF
jgi:hypothetical protein